MVPSNLWKQIGWVIMFLGALIASVWAILFTAFPEFSETIARERMFTIAIIGFSHTVGGAIACIIGPFQFVGKLRRKYPAWHIWLGRIYLVCVCASALAGIYLSPNSFAANTYGIFFIMLGVAWLYTAVQAYTTIRRRDVNAHRRWMIRNYALTYAAPSLRLQMPFMVMAGMDPIFALNLVGLTCWVPSLIVVEWWMRSSNRKARYFAGAVARPV